MMVIKLLLYYFTKILLRIIVGIQIRSILGGLGGG